MLNNSFLIALSNGDFSFGVRARNRTSTITATTTTTTTVTPSLPTGNNFILLFICNIFHEVNFVYSVTTTSTNHAHNASTNNIRTSQTPTLHNNSAEGMITVHHQNGPVTLPLEDPLPVGYVKINLISKYLNQNNLFVYLFLL